MVLKHLEDGRQIKSFIQKENVSKAVIIGMGYIAMEMCEALCSLNIQVSMIKPRSGLLPWMNEKLSAIVQQELEARKVSLYQGVAIHRIEQAKDGLVVCCDGIDLSAGMILVATGIQPNSEMAATAGLETGIGRAISTDRYLRTSDPHIYAAGDCADAFHVVTGKKTWIPLALRANRAGWAAADNVCGKPASLPGIVGTAVFRVFDLEVAGPEPMRIPDHPPFGFI